MTRRFVVLAVVAVCIGSLAWAQQPPPATPLTTVPRVVRVSGAFHPADGQPVAPVEGVTLAIYGEERGGVALWQETQNATVDGDGHYSVLMGSTLVEGIPLELFSAGEPRWLGVQFNRPGESEQPRTRLVSVPFALKASDADTLAGRPASAYVLSAPAGSDGSSSPGPAEGSPSSAGVDGKAKVGKVTALTSGTTNFLGRFTSATDLGNSALYQNGSRIGLGLTAPSDFFHVAFTDTSGGLTGVAVQNLGSGAASYSGMLFYDQTGVLGQFQGFNNSTHEYRINNIASGGTINFMLASSSKFYVASSGKIGLGTTTPSDQLTLTGMLALPATAATSGTPTAGVIKLGGDRFLHNYGPASAGNTFVGQQAGNFTMGGPNLWEGKNNTASGYGSLANNTTGFYNTASGYQSLLLNTTGTNNTASGYWSLSNNTTGSRNTASGMASLLNNATGSWNTASGYASLLFNTTGYQNIALGYNAGHYLTTGSYNIDIGNQGVAAEGNTIRIGDSNQTRTFISGIRSVTTGSQNAIAVLIDSNGQLGTASSSRRFKKDIRDMGEVSSRLLELRPVSFRYIGQSEGVHFGLIAEEVERVMPELVVRDATGQPETVAYHELPAMLLNELQKQHATIQEQQGLIEAQRAEIDLLKAKLAKMEARLAGRR